MKNIEASFDFDFLEDLSVGVGELSRITEIPVRQIRYWEDKGIIKSLKEEDGRNKKFDYKNVSKILQIKDLLEEGYTLETASYKIEIRLAKIEIALNEIREGKV